MPINVARSFLRDANVPVNVEGEFDHHYRASLDAAKDGKWRKLRMKVNPPKGIQHLNVRSKAGYYAPMADAAATTANKN